jgi:hypothetical protein
MELEIVPEPPEAEREALEEALARLLAPPHDPYGGWWRAGVLESVSPEEESD